jgi:sulfur-oxidizing protein SoxZ
MRLMTRPASMPDVPIGEAKIALPEAISPNSVIDVRTLISHPMHTGFFFDKDGNRIAAHFIQEVVVSYGGERIARFEWTSGISRDPFVTFTLKASREAPLEIIWKDNKGGVFRKSAKIQFS